MPLLAVGVGHVGKTLIIVEYSLTSSSLLRLSDEKLPATARDQDMLPDTVE